MRTALLDGQHEVFPIADFKEHEEYFEWQQQLVDDDVKRLIRNAIPSDRWNHYYGKCAKAIHSMALLKMQFNKAAPLIAHTLAINEYHSLTLMNVAKCIKGGNEKVTIINKNGGFHEVSHDRLSYFKLFHRDSINNVTIIEGSSVLVLENDPELDEWTKKNLEVPHSSITSLRKLSNEQLRDAMAEFCNQVPDRTSATLFVYTTGLDQDQMHEYVEAALLKGINKFVFVKPFVDDYNPSFKHIKEFILKPGSLLRICKIFDDPSAKKDINTFLRSLLIS